MQFGHFGASNVIVTTDNGTIDARTSFRHLTCNIKIRLNADQKWGFTLVNYGFKDNGQLHNGLLTLSGVELKYGSQRDNGMPTLFVKNSLNDAVKTIVNGSSLAKCLTCVSFVNSTNVIISTNVFSDAYQMAATFKTIAKVTFNGNLIINVWSTNAIVTACLAMYERTNKTILTHNFCHGSTMHAYIFPYIDCE